MVRLIWQRGIIFMAISAAAVALAISAGVISAAPVDDINLVNEYIAITVNAREENTGRFSIKTTGGDPDRLSDDNAHLIYRREDQKGPWTSFTTVHIDGESWVYGGPTRDSAGANANYGVMIMAPVVRDDRFIESAWQLGPIKAAQTLSFVRSSTTGLIDTARIATELVNTDTEPHMVGFRLTLDTMLGDNDGAPYRVDDKAILTDTKLSGEAIPEFWQAFDSLSDPKVTAQGTLRGEEVTTPDAVYFTNWGSLSQEPWDVVIIAGRDFTREGGFDLDSAMALRWEPIELAPGQSRTFISYVGLGGLTIAPGQLQLAITSPSSVVAGQSFPVIAYVQNSGTGEARSVEIAINLPPGLRLVSGQAAARAIGTLPVNQTGQVRWNVVADGAVGRQAFSVDVSAMNADGNSATREIEVMSPAQIELTLQQPQGYLAVVDGEWQPLPYTVEALVRNTGQAVATGVTAQWSSSRGLQLAAGDTDLGFVGDLRPGESYTLKWFVTPMAEVGNLPYKITAAIEGKESAVANGLLRVPPLDAVVRMSALSDTVAVGDEFNVSIDAYNLKEFHSAQIELIYDPTRVRLLGSGLDDSLGVDRGTLFMQVTDVHEQKLTWLTPEHSIDVSQPLARLTIAGDRASAPLAASASGTLAVLRLQALKPGTANILIDKISLKDRYEQELQAEKEALITIMITP
ncbi:MAG: hypothetical protein ACOX44_03500 [Limnochordia bacterium]